MHWWLIDRLEGPGAARFKAGRGRIAWAGYLDSFCSGTSSASNAARTSAMRSVPGLIRSKAGRSPGAEGMGRGGNDMLVKLARLAIGGCPVEGREGTETAAGVCALRQLRQGT